MKYTKTKDRFQGFLFAYELRSDRLRLLMFRCIVLASIPLADIRFMRLMARREYLDVGRHRHWPMLMLNHRGQNPVYVIRTRKGSSYFLRLNGQFHYKVRNALGKIKRAR